MLCTPFSDVLRVHVGCGRAVMCLPDFLLELSQGVPKNTEDL